MNRCAVILLLALLLAMAPAALAQDVSDAFEPDSALAVSDGRMILIGETETATLLQMDGDGVTPARCRLEEDGSLYTPFVFADGRTGFLVERNLYAGDSSHAFCYWGAGDTAGAPIALGGDLRGLQTCGNGFAAVQTTDDAQAFVVYDDLGRLVLRHPLRAERRANLVDCVQDADGGYLAAISYTPFEGEAYGDPWLTILRLSPQGREVFSTELAQRCGLYRFVLTGDGEGGAFVLFPDWDNYKVAQVFHLSAEGRVTFRGVLEAQNLICYPDAGSVDRERGSLILTGCVISKSRGVYDVIQLAITGDGEIAWSKAWDFSARPDYSFRVQRTGDGALLAVSDRNYLDTKDAPLVAVPVNSLPEIGPPVLTLRLISP